MAADTALLGPGVYLDAQLFSYHPKPKPTGDGKVKVALLSMGGADGHSPLSTSLQYLDKAGSLGTDLAVLPENFAQKHVGKVGDMDPPPQPVTGPPAWRLPVPQESLERSTMDVCSARRIFA